MKKILITLIVALAAVGSMSAQNDKMTTQKLYEKYEGRENIVTMNIPGSMLAATGEMPKDVANKINGLIMIISEDMPEGFVKDIDLLLKGGDYISLMNINADGERVGMYVSKDSSEFLMVV